MRAKICLLPAASLDGVPGVQSRANIRGGLTHRPERRAHEEGELWQRRYMQKALHLLPAGGPHCDIVANQEKAGAPPFSRSERWVALRSGSDNCRAMPKRFCALVSSFWRVYAGSSMTHPLRSTVEDLVE